jgi:hypothetical protein
MVQGLIGRLVCVGWFVVVVVVVVVVCYLDDIKAKMRCRAVSFLSSHIAYLHHIS